jgi:uncharacterized membrane protein
MIVRQATPKTLLQEVRRKDWYYLVICGIAQGLAAFAFLRALQFRDYFVEVTSITAAHVLLNVFVAYTFLRERGNLLRKLIAAAIIVAAIVIITLPPSTFT